MFRASGRLVEVHATVTDGRGTLCRRCAERLVYASGRRQVRAHRVFREPQFGCVRGPAVRCHRKYAGRPSSVKTAALKLLSELRAADAVAVYSFNAVVTELQPFTTDKGAAERAVLRPHALGGTALFDALVRVSRDLAARPGKKAIVVFTDGDDNASTLTAEIACHAGQDGGGAPLHDRARRRAEAARVTRASAGLSKSTGGLPFAIREPAEIPKVFESVSNDLTHGYLLTFQPPPDESPGWHTIKATLRAPRGRTVRAREGYSLE